jgi:hypothetical protein
LILRISRRQAQTRKRRIARIAVEIKALLPNIALEAGGHIYYCPH